MDNKTIMIEEIVKCVRDPIHFMKKYCMIQHPTRGRLNFHLYPFQENVLSILKEKDRTLILKSRQLGISTLVAGYSLWSILFKKDFNCLCIATKQETAKNLVTKVKYMYENLPIWLKGQEKPLENNKLSLKLRNGSQVKAVSAAGDSGRSEAVSLLIIDEAAFINEIDDIFASAQQTVSTGGKICVLSTPNGTGNWFHRMWEKSENKENDFIPIKLPWSLHPERNNDWRKKQDDELGLRLAAQECDCNFNTSGDTVFSPEVRQQLENKTKTPVEYRTVFHIQNSLWIWESPDYTKDYIITVDVARGDGRDSSVIQILDAENSEQVAEFKGQIGTTELGYLSITLATEYNNGLLIIENTGIGWSTIQTVIEQGYKNIYYSPKGDSYVYDQFAQNINDDNSTPGFTTSSKTRPLLIAKLEEYITENIIKINSSRTINEIKTFIWKNGKAQSQDGYNDDCLMSLSIFCYLRETALRFKRRNKEQSSSLIANISTLDRIKTYNLPKHITKNPYEIEYGMGEKENISWIFM